MQHYIITEPAPAPEEAIFQDADTNDKWFIQRRKRNYINLLNNKWTVSHIELYKLYSIVSFNTKYVIS